MIRVAALCLAVCVVSGCSSPTEEAFKRYQTVKKHGSAEDWCVEAQKVADAHLAAGDEKGYENWRLTAYNDCIAAGKDIGFPSI